MERRSHRIAVLVLVVLLHVPVLFAIRDWLAPRFAPREARREMVVEFVLNEAAPPPAVRRRSESAKPEPSPAATPSRPPVREDVKPAASAATPQRPVDANPRTSEEAPPQDVRLFADDGTLRIPSTLSEDIAEKVVEGPDTFHIPAGDVWVLREPRAPVEYTETRFAKVFLPADMNPVEEACWRNKGFAFIMTVLGSRDCAAPGQKDAVPVPEMIVYGVDDADDILRKIEDWERYNER